MAVEIEKKFLLNYLPKALLGKPESICQGYIVNKKNVVVRLRLSGDKAFITIKGPTINNTRKEYEYPLPIEDAKQMLALFCQENRVEKKRYKIDYKGFVWEIDQFTGKNQGLIIAEIELKSVDQKFEKPDWIGKEVSQDARYYNSNLIDNPYSTWNP